MTKEESELPVLDSIQKTTSNIDVEIFFEQGIYPKFILVDAMQATS